MDRDLSDLQHFGVCKIFRESFKLIFSLKKIFSHITLALIFPLTFICLAQIQISDLIFGKILDTEASTLFGDYGANSSKPLKIRLSSEWVYFYLFRVAYLIFIVIFSLLSTSAVVYAVGCIYTGKAMTFKKVMGVVPKVWKRLLVTFFWNFIVLVVYNVAMAIIIVIWAVSIGKTVAGSVIVVLLVIIYLVGLVYISVIWELASVVSVLEEVYGLKAWKKSRILIKGKLFAASFIFVAMNILLAAIKGVFEELVVHGNSIKIVYRVLLGILCFLLLLKVFLLSLVIKTVIYFVCKSYHHEIIDKSSLSEHLEGYQGDYVQRTAAWQIQFLRGF